MADLVLDAAFSLDASKAFAQLRNIGAELDRLFSGKLPKLDLDTKPALDNVKKVGDEGEKAFKKIRDENGKFIKEATEGSSGLDKAFKFNQISQAISGAANTVNQLTAPFTALDTATANMSTLGDEAAAMAPHLREAAVAMSKDIPFSAAEMQTSMFDALASGVKGGEEGLKTFSLTAAKLATGGGATLSDATKLLAGNLNAYGKGAEEAAKFSDIFFNTINLGVVSASELNANLSNVVPTAAAAGIGLDGVGASIALMTSKGIPAAQSTTKLNALLLELQKPGAALAPILKAAGVSLDSLKKDDLPVTLEKINKAMIKTGQTAVGAFSSSEASAAFNTLASDIEGFKETFEGVKNTTGSTDFAFEKMSGSIEVKLRGLQVATEAYLINGIDKVGKGFVFAAGAAAQLAPVIGTFAGIKSILPEGAVGQIGSVVTGLLTKLIPSLGVTDVATGVTSLSFSAMWTAATGGVVLLVAGIAAVIAALVIAYHNVESVRVLFDKIGDAVVTFGKFVLTYVTLPFQILWETISVIASAIGELFSSGESGSEGFSNAMAVLGQVVDGVKATIVGLTAGIRETVKIFGEILDAAIHLDFGKAATLLGEAGGRLGDAVKGGIKKSMSESNFDDAIKGMSDSTKEAVSIKTKLDSLNELPDLQKSLEETQAKLQPLQVKVEAGGKLTPEEKKSFDELAKKANEVSGKINLVAPEAIAGVKTLVKSNGDLVQVYDVNKTKLDEVSAKQKKAFGDEATANQKNYSDGLLKLSAVYESQKQQLIELKKRIDAANARGDTKGAAELSGQYREVQQQIKATSDQITKGFQEGAKAGLLTEDATKKISGALGITAEQAAQVATKLGDVGAAAKAAEIDAKAMGDAFAKAKSDADSTAKSSLEMGAGIKSQADLLRKSNKENESAALKSFNDVAKTQFKTKEDALAASKKLIAQEFKAQQDAINQGIQLKKTEQSQSVEFRESETQKDIQNTLTKTTNQIEKEKRAAEKIARDNAIISKKSESELSIELLQIQSTAEQKKYDAQILAAKNYLRLKKTISAEDGETEQLKIDAISLAKEKAEEDSLAKIADIRGKSLVKEFDDKQKAADENYKREVENSKKSIQLIEERISTTVGQEEKRLSDLNAAQLNSIKNQNAIEIQEAVNKNAAVIKATEALRAAFATNDDAVIKRAETERETAIREAIKTDAVLLAINDKANIALLKQNKDSAASSALALREFTVARIADDAERERQTRLLEVDKTLKSELDAAKGNERLKNDAYAKAAIDRLQIEKDFANKSKGILGTLSDGFSQFASNISSSLRKSFDEAAKAQKDIGAKAREEYEKEASDLNDALKNQTISFSEFQDKVVESANKFKETTKDLGKSFGRLFADGFKDAMQGVADSFNQTAGSLVVAYQQSGYKIGNIAESLGDARKAKLKAEQDGNVEEISKATKTIDALQTNLSASTTENAKIAEEAFSSMTISLASSFGASIAEGKKNIGDYVIMALNALESLAPIIAAQIYGVMVSSPNPANAFSFGSAGFVAATALTLGLTALIEAAKAGVRSGQGKHDGGFTGHGGEWEVADYTHKEEYVFSKKAVKGEVRGFDEFHSILKGGVSISEILGVFKEHKNLPELSRSFVNPLGKIESGNFEQLTKLLSQHKIQTITPPRFTVKSFEQAPINYKQVANLNNDSVIRELRDLKNEVVSLRKENERMVAAQKAMPDSFLGKMNVGLVIEHDESISAKRKELDIRRKALQG